jgi:hypothetical protein
MIRWIGLLLVYLSTLLYLCYFVQRHETALVLSCYAILFGAYILLINTAYEDAPWLTGAVVLRLSLLFMVPNLSDDVYRFIWDGRLWLAGQQPFAQVPSDFLNQHLPGLDASLFSLLNSNNYTIYPPVAQGVFWLSARLSPQSVFGSIVVMRIVAIAAEVGSLWLMRSLLRSYQLPAGKAGWYAFNPLVILELTGNLHPEVFMIFFLLLFAVWLQSGRWATAAVAFAGAICAKLLPIMFLPFMPAVIGWRKAMMFYFITAVVCMLMFLPMIDPEALAGWDNSLHLYVEKFEFNASLYYLVRAYGFHETGYNIIQQTGWKLALVSGVWIGVGALIYVYGPRSRDNMSLWAAFLFAGVVYFFHATIVHPWYIVPLLMYSVFTRYRFMVVWSALIVLSYTGYTPDGYGENLMLTALEYITVMVFIMYELFFQRMNHAHH